MAVPHLGDLLLLAVATGIYMRFIMGRVELISEPTLNDFWRVAAAGGLYLALQMVVTPTLYATVWGVLSVLFVARWDWELQNWWHLYTDPQRPESVQFDGATRNGPIGYLPSEPAKRP